MWIDLAFKVYLFVHSNYENIDVSHSVKYSFLYGQDAK